MTTLWFRKGVLGRELENLNGESAGPHVGLGTPIWCYGDPGLVWLAFPHLSRPEVPLAELLEGLTLDESELF